MKPQPALRIHSHLKPHPPLRCHPHLNKSTLLHHHPQPHLWCHQLHSASSHFCPDLVSIHCGHFHYRCPKPVALLSGDTSSTSTYTSALESGDVASLSKTSFGSVIALSKLVL
ncbi:hypothetical protein WJX77_010471 [Trebouxia sp. C0004]